MVRTSVLVVVLLFGGVSYKPYLVWVVVLLGKWATVIASVWALILLWVSPNHCLCPWDFLIALQIWISKPLPVPATFSQGLTAIGILLRDLCIGGEWKIAWEDFTNCLSQGGIHLYSRSDSLVRALNPKNGTVTANAVYDSIVLSLCPPLGSRLLDIIWNGTLPRKISCFVWLAISNKLLTWDNLQKRGWIEPSVCALCLANLDSTQHLFVHCPVWLNLLSNLCDQHHLAPHTQSICLVEFLETWTNHFSKHNICCYLPFHTMWVLWKARNNCIFEGKKLFVLSMI